MWGTLCLKEHNHGSITVCCVFVKEYCSFVVLFYRNTKSCWFHSNAFLLLSIGCVLRLPSSFVLTRSHQRLLTYSRVFFLREHYSSGCNEIDSATHLSPSVCLLGDRHDIRSIDLGEGEKHDHSAHCEIQWGRTPFWPVQQTTVFQNTDSCDYHCNCLVLSIVDSLRALTGSSNALDRFLLCIPIVIALFMFQE